MMGAVATPFLIFVMAAAAICAILLLSRNATLLFEARVEQGKMVRLRGRVPKRLVRDFHDVLSVRPVSSATLRVHSSGTHTELRVKGDISEAEAQRLRNVLGMFPVARIRAEPYRTQ